MEQTMQQLRDLRKSLPAGKKDPWGKENLTKRVLLNRALKKDNVSEFTDGELAVFNEFLDHLQKVRRDGKEYEKKIEKILQK